MALRRSTWAWIAIWAACAVAKAILDRSAAVSGCVTAGVWIAWALSSSILLARFVIAAFRLVVRRLALRLAFSYFLIGIVPIPLLAALLSLAAYLVANQYVANRLRREATAVGESAIRSHGRLAEIVVGPDRRIMTSPLPGLPVGALAPWETRIDRPGFLIEGDAVWLAVADGAGLSVRLLKLTDPASPWLQELADRTGYTVTVETGRAHSRNGSFEVTGGPDENRLRRRALEGRDADNARGPRGAPPAGSGLWAGHWLRAFYLETALNARQEQAESGRNVAVLAARTSPQVIARQLFAQGVDEISRVFRVAFLGLGAALLLVYLVALGIAFTLVGSIARNVNRLTRSTRAVARGDFSVRVNSKSRDQIGDLARSFDAMAASIERLLLDTAKKERLESEIAMASTIQHKLLPPPEASVGGAAVHAHFDPVAEMGGDYYDYLAMPDGRTAFALGDVSGHGLPTGLLVAMAKSALSTLLEAGHEGSELFSRLNDLIHRSTDPRHYMTLAVLAYDPATRRGALTNAGQLAPYRVSASTVEALSLPSFPLGLFPAKSFPTREITFVAGDILVFHSDGFIEAVDAHDEPFGFDRFEAVLRSHAASGAAAIRSAILAAVAAHTGDRPADDDRTLLLLTLD